MSRRKDPSSVRICDVLLEMRRCRMGLIQTADQLRFSYLAVIEGAKYIMGDSSLQVGHRSQQVKLFCRHSTEFCSFLPLKDSWRELSNEEDDPPQFSPPPPLPPPREPHNAKTEPTDLPELHEVIQQVEIRSLG